MWGGEPQDKPPKSKVKPTKVFHVNSEQYPRTNPPKPIKAQDKPPKSKAKPTKISLVKPHQYFRSNPPRFQVKPTKTQQNVTNTEGQTHQHPNTQSTSKSPTKVQVKPTKKHQNTQVKPVNSKSKPPKSKVKPTKISLLKPD